jgi:hypothetical protein
MRLLATLACLSLFAAVMIAADVSGNWRGSIEVKMPDGEIVNYSLHMEAVQKGGEVTGTIGREAEEKLTIDNGKMEGNTLSFEVTPPGGQLPRQVRTDARRLEARGHVQGRHRRRPSQRQNDPEPGGVG